ncbi:hypothetical protein BU17DRAFT_84465 [Hysterangium stoloniferum]|nr:hypothetical protein BU17DRAFT_84465 [Hysterangium stoloniferum]
MQHAGHPLTLPRPFRNQSTLRGSPVRFSSINQQPQCLLIVDIRELHVKYCYGALYLSSSRSSIAHALNPTCRLAPNELSLYGSNHPSTHSMNADVLQNEVVQNAFLSSNYREVQNTPTRFLEQSGSCLVDGIYPSAGQHHINTDLTLLWEGEQYPFPYDERNDNDGPSRESSTGPIVTFPHPTSSTHPSPSSTASTHHKNALPWPQAPPTDCPWGDIYESNGNMGKCVWKPVLLDRCKTLEHWAWYHVTNDVFAFQTGILTDLQEAKIVNTPEKLECAILHLGLCPNQACQETVPRTVRAYRKDLVERHLKHSPECEPFFEDLSVRGYRELGKQLGYVWPGPKS